MVCSATAAAGKIAEKSEVSDQNWRGFNWDGLNDDLVEVGVEGNEGGVR